MFATVAFAWFGDAVTCLAGDHDTPLVVQTSLPSTVLDTGNDNIFLANFVWEDALRSAVRVTDDAGELDELRADRRVRAARAGHARGHRRRPRARARGGGHRARRRRHHPHRRAPRQRGGGRGGQPLQVRRRRRGVRHRQLLRQRRVHDRGRAAGLPPDLRHVRPVRGHRRPHPGLRARRAARDARSGRAGRASRPSRCPPMQDQACLDDYAPDADVGDPAGRRDADVRAPGARPPGPRGSRRHASPAAPSSRRWRVSPTSRPVAAARAASGPTTIPCPTRSGSCGSTSKAARAGRRRATGSTWMAEPSPPAGEPADPAALAALVLDGGSASPRLRRPSPAGVCRRRADGRGRGRDPGRRLPPGQREPAGRADGRGRRAEPRQRGPGRAGARHQGLPRGVRARCSGPSAAPRASCS